MQRGDYLNGWFKFHRKIFENPVCNKDSEHFHVWCWILANAEFEERRVLFNGNDITLKKGQLITTTKKISENLNINENKVRRILKNLENAKQIDKQTSTKNSLITVVNWYLYQSGDGQNDERVTDKRRTTDEQLTNERRTSDEPSYYIKNKRKEEDKEIKKEKKEEETISSPIESINRSDIQIILKAWNELENCGIKSVKHLKSTTERYERLVARIKEYGVTDILNAIENIKTSDFLQGKNNRGWTVTFDWFVRPNNFPKVLEGNYINGNAKGMDKGNINASKQLQLEYLLNSIREDEMNDRNRF